MNSKTHDGAFPPFVSVMGGGATLRPICPPTLDSREQAIPLSTTMRAAACPNVAAQPYRCITPPLLGDAAEGRAAPNHQRAPHPDQSARRVALPQLLGPAHHRNDDDCTAEGIGAAARGAGPAFALFVRANGGACSFHVEDITS